MWILSIINHSYKATNSPGNVPSQVRGGDVIFVLQVGPGSMGPRSMGGCPVGSFISWKIL